MKYGKHFVAVAILIAASTAAIYGLLTIIFRLPVAASAQAGPIDTLFQSHFLMISFLFSLVVVFALYALVLFRRKPEDDEEAEGDHFHGHTGLEVAWTILPLAAVVFFGVWGAQMLNDLTSPDPNEIVIKVYGQQWSWYFEYPEYDDLRTTELYLVEGQPVQFQLNSLDVLHSFWVPEFRMKQDLVPGQQKVLRITPSLIGEYKVRCAEICGTQHATMLAPVHVVSQADFDKWIESQLVSVTNLTAEERGQKWYEDYGCNACHSLDGTVVVGPSWQGLYGSERVFDDGTSLVADDAYITSSIYTPNLHVLQDFTPNLMPQNFQDRFAEEEAKYGGQINIVEDLIAFIKTLE
jgi:cytochrome c oxidase subunit 2